MNLGENIYRLRTEKNMSQGDLADALEVSRQSVSKWENNSAVPELDKLKKMSQLFGVTLDELVNGEKNSDTPSAQSPTVVYVEKRSHMPRTRWLGIILLGIGLIFFIAFTILGYFTNFILLGALIGFPFIFNGVICLLAEKHTLFALCWGNYIMMFIFSFCVTINTSSDQISPTIIVSFILLTAIIVWSLIKLHRGHFNTGRIGKSLWTIILTIVLLFHLWLVLDNILGRVTYGNSGFDEEIYSYISAEKESYAHSEDYPME